MEMSPTHCLANSEEKAKGHEEYCHCEPKNHIPKVMVSISWALSYLVNPSLVLDQLSLA